MTQALCFRCGDVKFGAICPCSRCGLSSTGDMQLDIAFSDHHLNHEQLRFFGSVVEAIRRASDDDQACFWVFIRYVSIHHSNILTAKVPDELADRVNEVWGKVEWPGGSQQPENASQSVPQTAPQGNAAGTNRKWWQFWK